MSGPVGYVVAHRHKYGRTRQEKFYFRTTGDGLLDRNVVCTLFELKRWPAPSVQMETIPAHEAPELLPVKKVEGVQIYFEGAL